MTKDESHIIDWRSTGRRKARRELYRNGVEYKCAGVPELNITCGVTSKEPPKDAPANFLELWPEEKRVLDYPLEADHESKDWQNNSIEFLNWRCRSCHKKHDSMTEKGESTVKNEWF